MSSKNYDESGYSPNFNLLIILYWSRVTITDHFGDIAPYMEKCKVVKFLKYVGR